MLYQLSYSRPNEGGGTGDEGMNKLLLFIPHPPAFIPLR
jgi:hypothetical protein